MKCLYLFSCILFLQSCSLTRSRLGEALQQNGKNREELERVLQYYSQKETDSLHLKSAQFLITHMPGHYSWQSEALGQDITFHHVPSKALYWLQNLTEGKEERIFTVENDEIVFH